MKKNYAIIFAFSLLLLAACQKEDDFSKVNNITVKPSFKEYSNENMDSVMKYMDEPFYNNHFIYAEGVEYPGTYCFDSTINGAGQTTFRSTCGRPYTGCCLFIYIHSDPYLEPCLNLMYNYGYDTMSSLDFAVICKQVGVEFYQGEISTYDTNQYGELSQLDLSGDQLSVTLENDVISVTIYE